MYLHVFRYLPKALKLKWLQILGVILEHIWKSTEGLEIHTGTHTFEFLTQLLSHQMRSFGKIHFRFAQPHVIDVAFFAIWVLIGGT